MSASGGTLAWGEDSGRGWAGGVAVASVCRWARGRASLRDGKGREPSRSGLIPEWDRGACGRGVQLLAAGRPGDDCAWIRSRSDGAVGVRGAVRGRRAVPALELYELALETGCEIVERHGHSVRLPGMPTRDATVAWNYVDLRFRPKSRTRLEFSVSDSELIAVFICEGSLLRQSSPLPILIPQQREAPTQDQAETCATCGDTGCSRHERAHALKR
jgi:hypothetical protein